MPPSATPPPPEPTIAPLPSAETVRVLRLDGTAMELPLEEYILGVVAAEMPASFRPAALEAQAVAARTYTLSRKESGVHAPEADVCADAACCQAYASPEELAAKWGEDAQGNLAKVRAAVLATAGLTLEYGGAPIQAVFHASSLGRTAEAGEVWGGSVPYLQSVSTPETAEDAPGLESAVTVPADDFREAVLAAYPKAKLDGSPEGWLGGTEKAASGRTAAVEVGGVRIPGTELRRLFSLRSADFEVAVEDGGVVFSVHGYGHGVGMSQYGANAMAAQGADFRAILEHYYPGAHLKQG